MLLRLDADLQQLVVDKLGAVEVLRTICSHPWLALANALSPNHRLWKEACMAETPLLAAMHAAGGVSWKSLLVQRRRLGNTTVPTWGVGCHSTDLSQYKLAFELTDSTGHVRRAGLSVLPGEVQPGHVIHRFQLDPLLLTLPQAHDLRLTLYLQHNVRICCLARNAANDEDDWTSWYFLKTAQCEIHAKMIFTDDDDEDVDHRKLRGLSIDEYTEDGGPRFVEMLAVLESEGFDNLWSWS